MEPRTDRRPHPILLVAVVALLAAAGCSVEATVTGDGGPTVPAVRSEVEPGSEPDGEEPLVVLDPVQVPIEGDDGNALNLIAGTAVADLEAWWAEEHPRVFGTPYVPLSGGLHAFGAGSDVDDLPCDIESLEDVIDNAYYCPDDDAVAWDQDILMPAMAEAYGEFTVAVVIAHEWGHVIQDGRRADLVGSPLTSELQADCFAGAWVAHARDARPSYFDVDDDTLDRAVVGILSLKDQPGSSGDDLGAHGSGFDRVSAFQEGFEDGTEACADYDDLTIRSHLFEFSTLDELYSEGNLPLHDSRFREGILTASAASLDLWWDELYPTVYPGAWEPVAVVPDPDAPASCAAGAGSAPVAYCPSGRSITYREGPIEDLYDEGDFAVAVLVASRYAVAAQIDGGIDVADDPLGATLRGDCFAGAWGADLIRDDRDPEAGRYGLVLSPGDLDEGVAALLLADPEPAGARTGGGFERVRAFRIGVLQGVDACIDFAPIGG